MKSAKSLWLIGRFCVPLCFSAVSFAPLQYSNVPVIASVQRVEGLGVRFAPTKGEVAALVTASNPRQRKLGPLGARLAPSIGIRPLNTREGSLSFNGVWVIHSLIIRCLLRDADATAHRRHHHQGRNIASFSIKPSRVYFDSCSLSLCE
jgi:hypothetical protein